MRRRTDSLLTLVRSSAVAWVPLAASFSKSSGEPAAARARFADSVLRASELLSSAGSVLFVTGAGISAESGLPTYRGVSGLYNDAASTEDDGLTIEECLSGGTYRARPDLTWKYLLQIEKACRGAEPSRAHRLVAAAEKFVRPGPVTCMTQNVDGLHARAGSTDVICLHGELHRLRCTGQCKSTFEVDSYFDLEVEGNIPPRCRTCGGAVRPNVVLFDEYLGDDTVSKYEEKLGVSMADMWYMVRPEFPTYDVSVSIGTSALFQYVQGAALSGKRTIEINPMRTPLSDFVDVRIEAGATESLEAIYNQLEWEV